MRLGVAIITRMDFKSDQSSHSCRHFKSTARFIYLNSASVDLLAPVFMVPSSICDSFCFRNRCILTLVCLSVARYYK
jgi:hypothetical protein